MVNEKMPKGKTVFYITEKGRALAGKLKCLYPDIDIVKYSAKAVKNSWYAGRRLIFIMASGIVVRTIAPLLKDKKTDPGIVVMDEKGQFVTSLLSGHLGGANDLAADIARFLGGSAVITTASDVNHMPSLDLWARRQDFVIERWDVLSHISTKLLNEGALSVYSDTAVTLPAFFFEAADAGSADICITNRSRIECDGLPAVSLKDQLYLRPKNLAVGIGCNSGTSASEIEDAVMKVLDGHNLSFLSVDVIATVNLKAGEPGLMKFARKYGLKVVTFTPYELNAAAFSDRLMEKSETVFKATGAYAVAEAASLMASGARSPIARKQKIGNVTVAISEKKRGTADNVAGIGGKIYMVGTGPGNIQHITPYAQEAIRRAAVVVGYGTYLDLISELIEGKEVVSTGMTQEMDRCKAAVEFAFKGKTVAVISGGDPGIYAMAGLVLELLKDRDAGSGIGVEVIPGISALNAGASRLGAPLMHDFAAISLSDRLTPWEVIEKRLDAAAMADFVIVLFNPKSTGRPGHIDKARATCLRYRSAETPVGIVKAAMRENEKVVVTNLRDLPDHDIDMQTTVIIGNSATFVWKNMMITPRGYERKQTRKPRS